MEKIKKPFIIEVQELEQNIVEEINKSQLPVYAKRTILCNLYTQLEKIDIETAKEYNNMLPSNISQKKESDK